MHFLGGIVQNMFEERVLNCRKAERDRLRQEREETISNIIQSRKQERETKRKLIYFLRSEEERQRRLREEEEARRLEGTFLIKLQIEYFISQGKTDMLIWTSIKALVPD